MRLNAQRFGKLAGLLLCSAARLGVATTRRTRHGRLAGRESCRESWQSSGHSSIWRSAFTVEDASVRVAALPRQQGIHKPVKHETCWPPTQKSPQAALAPSLSTLAPSDCASTRLPLSQCPPPASELSNISSYLPVSWSPDNPAALPISSLIIITLITITTLHPTRGCRVGHL